MRNLSLCNFQSYQLADIKNCEVFYVDQSSLFVYSNGHVLKYDESKDGISSTEICDLSNLYPGEIPKAVSISYYNENDAVFVVLFNGDIVSVEANAEPDIIGSVANGIQAAQWSPEQELVAVITGNDTVVVMTRDFDPLSEVNLHSDDFGEQQFITVGWGKKETQFRGSEGKFKGNDSSALKVDSNFESDDKVIRISWRGDAELFAVSCLHPETRSRYVKIFSREGVLQYTSELIPGLENLLNWRPSGNLIACSQKLPNKHIVCFLEKNGLKHGEFTLPYKCDQIIIKDMIWNEESKLLALLIEEKLAEKKYIHIYTSSNYHWYCKYTIECLGEAVLMKWDRQKYNLLHVISMKENINYHYQYTWLWFVNKSRGHDSADQAFTAVIDGSKLLLTSFKSGIVPPPMCTYELDLPLLINAVGFAPANQGVNPNDLFVQLSDGSIMIFKYINKNHELCGKFKVDTFGYNYQWATAETFLCCKIKSGNTSKPYLAVIKFDGVEKDEKPIEAAIALLKICDDCVLIHDHAGKLYDVSKTISDKFLKELAVFTEIDIARKQNGSYVVLALDKSNKFYVDGKLIANNITSFHVHEEFLLLTSLKHQLLTLDINSSEMESTDLCPRRVERGSRLVTSFDTKVILQMPRGNLECVQPRTLTLAVIGRHLDNLQFYQAFDAMRKQRINLNLLHDHNPELFVKNAKVFIDQIEDPSWISLFLSELSDEDVTTTMYSIMYKTPRSVTVNKVLKICELIERTLAEKNPGAYILPILTTFIKRNQIQHIETALLKIKTLKEEEEKGIKPLISSNEALKYILYLIDVEDIYKVALGMYDFDLVVLIASKSQKDPKEYLPFLNELRKLEGNYQKYTIDKHLKRYEKALKHLLLCDGDESFSESLNFIKAHKLHKIALKLTPRTTDRYKQICACYGEDLMGARAYEEAGIMFTNAGLYARAVDAFRKSGNWQEVISCAQLLNFKPLELSDVYRSLATDLIDAKHFKEASIIYLDYLKNVEECLSALCLGKLFTEAFRIAYLYNRRDIIQTHVKRGVIDHYHSLKTQITSYHELLTRQKNRLTVVRAQKLRDTTDFERGDEGEHDLYSEASSVVTQSYATSRSSARTFRSSKNRRKQERKLLSLKEGSQFEDLALIVSLHNLVTNCLELKSEVHELNKNLIKIKEDDYAADLQKIMCDTLKEIESSKSEIWTSDLVSGPRSFGPDATSNSIAEMHMKQDGATTAALLQPQYTFPPTAQSHVKWELEILKS